MNHSLHKRTVPADWSPDAGLVAKTKAQLEAAGVTRCLAAWTDVYGAPKAKVTPVSCFEKMCAGAELYTVGAVEGMGLNGPHEDECAAVPDLAAGVTVCPWDPQTAWLHADLYYHGAAYPNDPRRILRRAMDRAKTMGLSFNLGIEPEFYLFKIDETTGQPAPPTPTAFKGPNACYDVQLTAETLPALAEIGDHLERLGWGLYSYDQECGRGQHEFDFGYTDALTSSDRLVFFRQLVKHVATQHGLVASFMPKPFADDFRSGAHFNMSLEDASGTNVFVLNDGDTHPLADAHGLPMTATAYHFAAGLLAHAGAITAAACSTYNSYQGLIARGALGDFSWAPVLVTYGHNNRSSMLRCPLNRPCIENRAVDMAVNPYLAAALMLHAGLDGIEQKLDPGAPFNNDLYRFNREELKERGVHTLPPTLLHALEAFEADPLVEKALGSYKDIYLAHKRTEWERGFYPVHDAQRDSELTRL